MAPLLVLAALLAGLAASLCLALVTSVVAYWGPHADSYFLGGNSALQFSYELAPALVSGGWCILGLRFRGHQRAVLLGGAAGLFGAGLISAYWAIAILTGHEFGLAVLALLWDVTAPVLALSLPLKGTRVPARRDTGGTWWYVAAAAVLLLAITVPTLKLEQCGPALGSPMSPREFVVCVPSGR